MSLSAGVSMRLAATFRSRVVITAITSRRCCHSRAPDHLILVIHMYRTTAILGTKRPLIGLATTYRLVGRTFSLNNNFSMKFNSKLKEKWKMLFGISRKQSFPDKIIKFFIIKHLRRPLSNGVIDFPETRAEGRGSLKPSVLYQVDKARHAPQD